MVKPTPDPPLCNLPHDHPLLVFPPVHFESDGKVLAERFARQRALIEAARRNAKAPPRKPPLWQQFWRWFTVP